MTSAGLLSRNIHRHSRSWANWVSSARYATSHSKLSKAVHAERCRNVAGATQLIWRRYSAYSAPAQTQAVKRKVTIQTIQQLHRKKEPITVMTAHDYPSGTYCDLAEMEICLVGDSLAMVALGYNSTNAVTFDEMLHHCRAVARGCKTSFLVGDMPFGTYETSPEQAVTNAVRMVREGRMEAVKLEGGVEMAPTVAKITSVGIPVLGHIGLTPQRASSLGGFKAQGKTLEKAKSMLMDALALQKAGCFAIVLEAVPEAVATYITEQLSIPTIGIGAGPGCSGQVLVALDTLGVYDRHVPKFCKIYANVGQVSVDGLKAFASEVKSGVFPEPGTHTYKMGAGEEQKFLEWVKTQEGASKPKH